MKKEGGVKRNVDAETEMETKVEVEVEVEAEFVCGLQYVHEQNLT